MLRILVFSLLFSLAFSIKIQKPFYNIDNASYYFNDFISTYNKTYSSYVVRQERLKIFTENLRRFNEMNEIDTAVHGINQFADLTVEEFLRTYTGLRPSQGASSCKIVTDADIKTNVAPVAFDWRDKNLVTPVKNQGNCGSCYAFSSIGNIESQYAIKNGGTLLDLSEQQLVDCSRRNLGCHGGLMTECMTDIMEYGGLEAEADYPYVTAKTQCHFQQYLAKVQLRGCYNYNINDENKLKEVLYTTGPIAIAVAATDLMSYTGGIVDQCRGEVDHAVLLVGYGSENGIDFWSIKNSWAETFGEQGYVRILRGRNTCRILNPLAASAIVI